MNFLSLLVAFLIEQVWPLNPRCTVYRLYARYAVLLGRHFNAGESRQGVIAWLLGVLPWAALAWIVYYLLGSVNVVLAWGWNVLVLYVTMGFRQFSHGFTTIAEALRAGDLDAARRELGEWRGDSATEYSGTEIAKVAIEEGLIGAHQHVFGVMFWFLVLPGPAGAVLYRLALLLHEKWGTLGSDEYGDFGAFARRAFALLDWIPARLTAMGFAVAGDFEDAVYCWRSQAQGWLHPEQGIVLASGAGALGVRLGETLHHHGTVSFRPELGLGDEADVNYMTSAVGLIWRTLVIWMFVVALVTVARYLGA
ncbi:MAG TPA: CobD/CbiB family protein [Burkholderiales bacterium]|nr:CobD/CbiB family protein [Burkholderiales bacterium]